MVLINLTPHKIVVCSKDGAVLFELPPSGDVARVASTPRQIAELRGVPLVRHAATHIEGLPEPTPGIVYVASSMVAQAAAEAGRSDVVAPDTSPDSAIRNAEGQIVGVRWFQTFSWAKP